MKEEREASAGGIDVFEVLRRRGTLFVAVAAAVVLAGVAVAYRSMPLYASRGVLLAEQPGYEGAVRPTVPESRVRIITQRVLTNANLDSIIVENGLYPELREMPAEARARFRQHLDLSAEDPAILESLLGTTRPGGALAFSVQFRDGSPRVARDVADDLVLLYLEENRAARREQAAETIRFLTQEASRIDAEIAERERRLAEFKGEHAGALPELAESNMQMLDRVGRDLDAVEQEIRSLRERQALYSSELAQMSPSATVLNDQGNPVLSPYDRLKMLQREYLQLSAIYRSDHPDVQKVRRELDALSASTGLPAFDRTTLQSELLARQDELAAASERYAADHPDVVRLERAVAAARAALAEVPATRGRRLPDAPDNPAYIQREVQLRAATTDLQAALQRRDDLRVRYDDLEQRLQLTPEVERDYNALRRGHEQLIAQFNDTQAQINQARMALNLEEDPNSERFTVLEQPSIASSPVSPNRLAVLLLTLAIAVALASGTVALVERGDQSVRNSQDVIQYLQLPPLVSIPYVDNRADRRRRMRWRVLAAGAVGAWLGAIVFLVVAPV